jgi:hypothetical protein
MLTDEKIKQIAMKSGNAVQAAMYGWPAQNLEFARAIESAVREECAAPVAEVSASGHDESRSAAYDLIDRFLRNNTDDLNYADYAHALDVIYAFAPPEPLDKLPGGNAYQEGWIDGTQAYQLTIEQQGEQK